MYNLYHQTLCPFSRKVRFVLTEKGIDFALTEENLSERRPYFVALNPAIQVPVIENPETGEVVCGSDVICEYVEEKFGDHNDLMEDGFVGKSPLERAEVRRIQSWFDDKFYNEVTKYILSEKLLNSIEDKSYTPNPKKLRAAYHNINMHFDYIEYLLRKRKWLGGEFFSLADISAAAQISSVDYFGDIDWEKRPRVKDWYSLVKSKKGFKPILNDRIRGFKPPKWYDELDF
jgi:glutathione S-transferase